jgi:peroxiredoxin
MRRWLLAAGVYNLAWGAAVVLFPDLPLRLFGVEPLAGTGRAIWQCLGMVIGVYGIGYLAASLNPIRHWPIVLVGFLGKVFGPIGFVWCAARGEIDWRFGLTIPTNDILWWIPFALILRASWDAAKAGEPRTDPTMSLGTALNVARDQRGRTLAALSKERPVLLVGLRHFGCTFCRETLATLARDRESIERNGTHVVVLHTATPEEAVAPLARAGLADLPAIADPDGSISRALGIERGSFNALLGPRNVARALPALLAGHGIGYPVGDPLQMPAAFVIHRGRVLQHQHHAYAGEPVDFRSLLGAARAAQGRSGSIPLAPAVAAAHT